MTYKNSFVAVVKCDGSVLRENDGAVVLPFGSEYSILLKNLDSRRAVVGVSIDGQDVVGGSRLVVEPRMTAELDGFMDGNVVRNRFRFVQKTDEIVEHRGDRIDDGIVRVEVWFEKRVEVVEHVHHHYSYPRPYYWAPYPCWEWNGIEWRTTTDCNTAYGADIGHTTVSSLDGDNVYAAGVMSSSVKDTFALNTAQTPKLNPDEGITVRGSDLNQSFVPVFTRELESSSTVITLRLVGRTQDSIPVVRPVTTKDKLACCVCGTASKATVRYCSNCGAYLHNAVCRAVK